MNISKYKYICIIFCLIFPGILNTVLAKDKTNPIREIRLQLKWKHQFQFAGYYAAIEKGFYKEAGLDVKLIEANGQDAVKAVMEGKSEFGVSTTDIIRYNFRKHKPVVLATIFQHSPQVILASKKSGIENIHDLLGKKIAVEPNAADIITYMTDENVPLSKCKVYPHSYNTDQLINGEVDAVTAYMTDEPFLLNKIEFKYTVISPLSGGIDFYGDLLFSTNDFVNKEPELTKKFVEASLKGWEYALNNTKEIAELIFYKYSQRHSIEHLMYEAEQMQRFIMSDAVELGYTNPGRWNHIIETYQNAGLIKQVSSQLDKTDEIDNNGINSYVYYSILIFILVVLLVLIFVMMKLTGKMRKEIIKQKEIQYLLSESEEKYRVITENMKDVVWTLDLDTLYFNYVSPSVEKLRGYTAEEIMAKPLDDALTEESRKVAYNALKNGIDQFYEDPNRYYTEILAQPCKDGSIVWTEVITRYYRNPKTKKIELLGVTRDVTERLKTEEQNRKMSQAMEQSPASIVITDIRGDIEYVNPKFTELTGYSKEEVIGKNPRILKSSKTSCHTYSELWETISTGNTWKGEFDNIKKDGSIYHESAVIAPIVNKEGEITHFLAVKEDITEKRKIETAVKENEAKLRTVIDTLPDGFAITDMEGVLQYISPQGVKMWGYDSASEMLGNNVLDFLHPNYKEKAIFYISEMLKGNMTGTAEYLMVRKDGSEFFAEANANILKDINNEPAGILYIERDISERKIAEKALQESEERHRLLFDTAQEAIVVAQNNKMKYFNPVTLAITEYSKEELLNIDFIDMIHDDDKALILLNYQKRINGEFVGQKYRIRIITKSGAVKWVEISGAKFVWNSEPAALSFINDITEQKAAEDKLHNLNQDLQASKYEIEENLIHKNELIEELTAIKEELELTNNTKDKFFSIIAHDLKNPLGSFRDLSKMMFEEYTEFTHEERIEFLELMKTSAGNIFNLLENLLEWSRSQQGTLSFNPVDFDISTIIKSTINLLMPLAENKQIQIENNVQSGSNVFADPNLINTVIRNLLSNAVKFTPVNGNISIKFKNLDAFVYISVSDNGLGMTKETVDKLFRIDVNVSTLGTSKEKGTGLGLILCKEFVEMHSGTIKVESKYGSGSVFEFSLPQSSNYLS